MSARSVSPVYPGISAQSSLIHPDESESLHMASTPNINLPIHDAGLHDSTKSSQRGQNSDSNKHDLSYKSKLRYVPSKSFVGETTSINGPEEGASAPNTFKHKSHPNAKTKSHIMLSSVEERLSTMFDGESSKALLQRDHDHDASIHHSSPDPARDFFASCLNQSWQEQSSCNNSNRLKDLQAQLEQMGLTTGAETLIHKKSHDKPIPTADWKKAQKASRQSQSHQPLHHIFNSDNYLFKNESNHQQNGNDIEFTSDSSSEFLDSTSSHSISEREKKVLEDLYEKNKDMPDSHEISPASPLKLYQSTYNTFTKGFLGNVLKNLNGSSPRDLQHEQKREDFNSQQKNPEAVFYNNADNIFQKIKNNGAFHADISTKKPIIDEVRALPNKSMLKKTKDDESEDENNYTSISGHTSAFNSGTFANGGKYLFSSSYLPNFNSDHNDYTRDQSSQASGPDGDSGRSSDTIQHSENQSEYTSVNSKEYTADDTEQFSYNTDSHQDSMASQSQLNWKKAEELRKFLSIGNLPKVGAALKGTVKPGQFANWKAPTGMDAKSGEWSPGNKENYRNVDIFKQGAQSPGILKGADYINKNKTTEVTFIDEFSSADDTADFAAPDVTRVSILEDISFSQSGKRVVSLITEACDNIDWKTVKSIDLSQRGVEHLAGLDDALPALQRVNLASNNIRHLEGLPRTLNELDISHNDLNEITTFLPVPELLFLYAQSNNIDNFSCLSHNTTLTTLNLGRNRLKDLAGLENLSNLVTLNLELNLLHGELDFSKYDLPQLQELRLNNNKITSIHGLSGLKKLNILDLANNYLSEFSCPTILPNLKKLILSSNQLRYLNVKSFPSLRILRIDGNEFSIIDGLDSLRHIWEVSAMFQRTEHVTQKFCKDITDVSRLNLSGNRAFFRKFYREVCLESFYNVNVLNLQAVNLTKISNAFVETFPNVRQLNLNFNNIQDILGLANLCSLKELYLVHNNVRQIEPFLSSLVQSRGTLEVLDLKMNPCTLGFYPDILKTLQKHIPLGDVFSLPQEGSKLQIDDMESFANVSKVMEESKSGWEEQDQQHNLSLRSQKDNNYNYKRRYEAIMIEFFYALQELDGLVILKQRCKQAKKDMQRALDNLAGNS